MANTTNIVKAALAAKKSWATFLADPIGAGVLVGTISDLISSKKSENIAVPVPRTKDGVIGKELMNLIDDFLEVVYDNATSNVGAWESVKSIDYSAQSNTTVGVDATIDGIDHHLYNASNSANSQNVNGTGLHVETKSGGGVQNIIQLWASESDAPFWLFQLEEAYSYNPLDSIRVAVEMSHTRDADTALVHALSSVGFVLTSRTGSPETLSVPYVTAGIGRHDSVNNRGILRTTVPSGDSDDYNWTEAGITDIAKVSVLLEYHAGIVRAWIGGPRSGGAWPTWSRAMGGAPFIYQTSGRLVGPFGDKKLAFVMAAERNENGNNVRVIETDVHYLEVFKRSEVLP